MPVVAARILRRNISPKKKYSLSIRLLFAVICEVRLRQLRNFKISVKMFSWTRATHF